MTIRITKHEQVRMASIPIRSPRAMFLAGVGLLVTFSVGATDYSQYTTDELVHMHTQSREVSEQKREEYREELRLRTQNINHEEWQNLGLDSNRDPNVDENRRLRASEDNDRGRGELVRDRSRSEFWSSNYGHGYEQRQNRGSTGGGMGQGGHGGGGRGR